MKFVLVNDRSYRVQCGEQSGQAIGGKSEPGSSSWDHDCYADHCKSAAQALANLAETSFLASSQMKARSKAET